MFTSYVILSSVRILAVICCVQLNAVVFVVGI